MRVYEFSFICLIYVYVCAYIIHIWKETLGSSVAVIQVIYVCVDIMNT